MSLDPYRDPVLYDLEYEGHTRDIVWYSSLVHRLGGPVLELGCGTGRIAIPLLRAGHEVVGVDAAEPMLAAFRDRLEAEPEEVRARATLHRADFLELELGRRFPTVLLPFNALHHCPDEAAVARLLGRVRAHLADRGIFALDCYLPDPVLYGRNPDLRYEERVFRRPDNGQVLRSWEQSWFDEERAIHHVRYIYQDADGAEQQVQLDLKMWSYDQLHAMLAAAGFAVVAEMADFEGAPMGPDALQTVLVLTQA